MKIIDISWPITNDMTEYKDRKTVKLEPAKTFEKDKVRETMITLHSHTGTHIDSPAHFLKNGKTVDRIDLNQLIGDCQVLDLTHVKEKITTQDLQNFDIKETEIILLKTTNSNLAPTAPFKKDFVYLEQSGAQYLADKKIKCVGIDYLGIERNQPNHETHNILLEHNIPIIEGLRLKQVKATHGIMYCLPLPLHKVDSALCRVIFIEK